MLKLTAEQIAEMVGGVLKGPNDVVVTGVASLEAAGEDDVSFLKDKRLAEAAAKSRAGALIAPCELEGYGGATIVCDDPETAFCEVLARFYEDRFPRPAGVSESALVDPSASLGEGVAVGAGAIIDEGAKIGKDSAVYPLAYVGRGVEIGERTVIYPHVSILDGVMIGSDCVIHCNSVIGESGFGYIQREGRHVHIPQVGGVRIGDRVAVGALVTIDRAMLDETVIEDGVKIDSHSHLAHNTYVGADSLLVAYAKVAGSARLGKGVVLAEDVGVSDHITMGEGAMAGAGSGVAQDVEPGQVVWGNPARPIGLQRRVWVLQGRLPEMYKRLSELEGRIAAILERLDAGGTDTAD